MCSALDSVEQARMVSDLEHPAGWSGRCVSAAGIAAVRAPLLLADRLVVTPNQLFDGRVLLALGPDGLAQISGYAARNVVEPLPLQIAVPARIAAAELPARHRLEAALASLVRFPGAPDDQPLRRFRWSLLPEAPSEGPGSAEVAERMASLPADGFHDVCRTDGVPAGVAWALAGAGVQRTVVAALRRRWEDWLDAADRYEVLTVVQDGIRDPDVTPALVQRGAAAAARATRATDRLVAELRRGLQEDRPDAELPDGTLAIRTRTHAYGWLDQHAATLPAEAQRCLRRWVDLVYLRSQARQAGALVLDLEVVDRGAGAARRHPGRLELVDDDALPLRIERGFLAELRGMPPELFSTVRFRLRAVTAGFRTGTDHRGERRAARAIAAILSEELVQPEPQQRYRMIAVKVVMTLAATLLLLVDHPLVIMAAVVLVVVTLSPEIEQLVTLRPGRMRQRFDLRRRRR